MTKHSITVPIGKLCVGGKRKVKEGLQGFSHTLGGRGGRGYAGLYTTLVKDSKHAAANMSFLRYRSFFF